MDFCDSHIQMSNDITEIKTTVKALNTRINGSIDDIHSHIDNGYKFRVTMGITAIGIIVTVITNAILVAYNLGQMSKQISINTARLEKIDGMNIK